MIAKSYWTEKAPNGLSRGALRCACARDGVTSLAQTIRGDKIACLIFDEKHAADLDRMDRRLDELLDEVCQAAPGHILLGLWPFPG